MTGPSVGFDVTALVMDEARNLLDRDDLDLSDDFFEVGGDSLIGMHFVARIGRAVGAPVRMTLLFSNPRLGEFASAVAAARGTTTAGDAGP